MRSGDAPFVMRGVTVQGVRRGRISWSRLYMEPVQETGADNDAAVWQNFAKLNENL